MGVLIGRSPHQKQSWMSASAVWEGSLNSILGKGGGGGWRGCLPGLVRRQHTSQCCSGSAAEISGQVEGTEHLSNTSFPHLHPGQIDWKCSVSGPELDLSYGRTFFFSGSLISNPEEAKRRVCASSFCPGCRQPLGSTMARDRPVLKLRSPSPQCPRSPSPPHPGPQ